MGLIISANTANHYGQTKKMKISVSSSSGERFILNSITLPVATLPAGRFIQDPIKALDNKNIYLVNQQPPIRGLLLSYQDQNNKLYQYETNPGVTFGTFYSNSLKVTITAEITIPTVQTAPTIIKLSSNSAQGAIDNSQQLIIDKGPHSNKLYVDISDDNVCRLQGIGHISSEDVLLVPVKNTKEFIRCKITITSPKSGIFSNSVLCVASSEYNTENIVFKFKSTTTASTPLMIGPNTNITFNLLGADLNPVYIGPSPGGGGYGNDSTNISTPPTPSIDNCMSNCHLYAQDENNLMKYKIQLDPDKIPNYLSATITNPVSKYGDVILSSSYVREYTDDNNKEEQLSVTVTFFDTETSKSSQATLSTNPQTIIFTPPTCPKISIIGQNSEPRMYGNSIYFSVDTTESSGGTNNPIDINQGENNGYQYYFRFSTKAKITDDTTTKWNTTKFNNTNTFNVTKERTKHYLHIKVTTYGLYGPRNESNHEKFLNSTTTTTSSLQVYWYHKPPTPEIEVWDNNNDTYTFRITPVQYSAADFKNTYVNFFTIDNIVYQTQFHDLTKHGANIQHEGVTSVKVKYLTSIKDETTYPNLSYYKTNEFGPEAEKTYGEINNSIIVYAQSQAYDEYWTKDIDKEQHISSVEADSIPIVYHLLTNVFDKNGDIFPIKKDQIVRLLENDTWHEGYHLKVFDKSTKTWKETQRTNNTTWPGGWRDTSKDYSDMKTLILDLELSGIYRIHENLNGTIEITANNKTIHVQKKDYFYVKSIDGATKIVQYFNNKHILQKEKLKIENNVITGIIT